MSKKNFLILVVIAIVVIFAIFQLTKERRANLKRINSNKENELRENWKNYTVYKRNRPDHSFQRGAVAFLYQMKDAGVIILDDKWMPVTSEEDMAKTKIMETVDASQVLGHNQELYGYLIYRSADHPNVKIIDERTVQLFYHYVRNYSN